jgi:hypothetical protein
LLILQVESDVTKCTKLMAEADAEVTKHKDVARELKAAKAEIQSNEEEMWRVDRETQHFKRQEATSRERIHRLDEQGAIKMEAAQTAVAAAMDDRNAVQSHNAATQAKIAELDHQVSCTSRLRSALVRCRQPHQLLLWDCIVYVLAASGSLCGSSTARPLYLLPVVSSVHTTPALKTKHRDRATRAVRALRLT